MGLDPLAANDGFILPPFSVVSLEADQVVSGFVARWAGRVVNRGLTPDT
jgi:hypothetical protein